MADGMLCGFAWADVDEAFWYSTACLLGGLLKGCWVGGALVPRSLRRTERACALSYSAQRRLDQRKHAHAYALVGGVTEAHPLAGCLKRVRKGSTLPPTLGRPLRCGAVWYGWGCFASQAMQSARAAGGERAFH